MSKEAKLHIKSKHNGEIPYQYGANECAKLMQSYADKVKKDDCINFANWLSKLSPSQKTSVWSKDGSMSGLFTMDNEQLYQRWLKEQLKTK